MQKALALLPFPRWARVVPPPYTRNPPLLLPLNRTRIRIGYRRSIAWSGIRITTRPVHLTRLVFLCHKSPERRGFLRLATCNTCTPESSPTTRPRLTLCRRARLFGCSASPSTSANQVTAGGTITSQSYPDWAMLDLFYSPSSLLSYGSPYEAYAGRTVTQVAPTQNTAVTYSNTSAVNTMYLFGTYGGATSGQSTRTGRWFIRLT